MLRNKFRKERYEYNGEVYCSLDEVLFAKQLDRRIAQGDVKDWERQVKYEVEVNGQFVANIHIDFRVVTSDDKVQLIEVRKKVKYDSPEWRKRRRLIQAVLDNIEPGAEFIEVRKSYKPVGA